MDLSRIPETPEKSASTKPDDVSVPFRTVLISIVVLWGAYFVLITLRSYFFSADMQLEMAARRFVVTIAGIGLTLVLWSILRLVDRQPIWIKIGAASLFAAPVALAIGQINHVVFEELVTQIQQNYAEERGFRFDDEGNLLYDLPEGTVIKAPGPDGTSSINPTESLIVAPAEVTKDTWRSVVEIALGRYFLLLAWASIYFALLAGTQARIAERREQQFRSAAKAAELRSLRYQVNPHFLFNTLNSLSALVMTSKTEQAERMIQTISRFYRHSLADEPTSDVALKDEFDLQKLYLDIEAVRFPERLRPVFELPEELEEARVPGMILQPLVENSVKYAVSAVARPVTIKVAAHEEFDRLVITVSDDGPGVPDSAVHGFGIGLANVSDRLEARFGSDIGFTSTPVPGGYRTEIRIPLSRPAKR
ncbi:histidine kinase [Erythrobacter sp. SCSIO 43205]|nr:histidine kinase [Erythrobacter sp. SCSIO 43205]